MLVQHLLTERLIREIFDNPEFTRRNVIAAEIEKVIEALTSKAFNRDVFLKSLDRFYVAIENAARTITDWSDKCTRTNAAGSSATLTAKTTRSTLSAWRARWCA